MGTEWYYQLMGQELGPISSADLKQKALAGEIDPNTLVHTSDHMDWFLADQVPGLFAGDGAKRKVKAKPAAASASHGRSHSRTGASATVAAPVRHAINDKIPKKRQEELGAGEEAYDFAYLNVEQGPAQVSKADLWILVTSRRVAYDAVLRKGENEYGRARGDMPLAAIDEVERFTSEHRLGCSGRRYSFLRITTGDTSIEILVPLEDEAQHLERSIADLAGLT